MSLFVLLAGVLIIFSSLQSGYFFGGMLGLLLTAVGFWLGSAPYEITAFFDKGSGKSTIAQKALLSRKKEGYAIDEMGKIMVVHVKRHKQSHDELRILFKNGKEIAVMGGAWRLETKENAAKLASFLGLPLEESEKSEGIWQGKTER